jgi:hypothetical protein
MTLPGLRWSAEPLLPARMQSGTFFAVTCLSLLSASQGRRLKAALRQFADFHPRGWPASPWPLTPANQDQTIRVLVRDGIDSQSRSDSLSKVAVHAHSGPLCLLLKRFVSYTGNLLSDVGPASRSSLANCMEGDVAVGQSGHRKTHSGVCLVVKNGLHECNLRTQVPVSRESSTGAAGSERQRLRPLVSSI